MNTWPEIIGWEITLRDGYSSYLNKQQNISQWSHAFAISQLNLGLSHINKRQMQ